MWLVSLGTRLELVTYHKVSQHYIHFTAPPPLHINSLTGQSPTKNHQVTEPHNRRWKVVLSVVMCFFALALLFYYQSISSHQPVKNSIEKYTLKYAQYVDNVKLRYKTHLRDVAQSFWLPTKMHTFIQLSLTSRDKPHAPIVDEDSPNTRIVSERSMTFDHLLSELMLVKAPEFLLLDNLVLVKQLFCR